MLRSATLELAVARAAVVEDTAVEFAATAEFAVDKAVCAVTKFACAVETPVFVA